MRVALLRMTALGLSADEALEEAEREERLMSETPLQDILDRPLPPWTPADSIRPEHLWGTPHSTDWQCSIDGIARKVSEFLWDDRAYYPLAKMQREVLNNPADVVRFEVGQRWGLDLKTGEWRAFTDEEQARGWMNEPTGFVTVTAVDREARTFTVSGDETPEERWRRDVVARWHALDRYMRKR